MNIILTGHYKKFFHNEFCFNSSSGGLHENNFIKFITLRDEFRNLGINLIADDSIDNHPNIDALIVHDHPTDINLLTSIANFRGPKYLTTEEAPFILPNSFSLDRSKEYRLVFTNYLNGDNFPVNFIFTIPNHIDIADVESVRKNDLEISKKNKKVFVGTNKKPTEKEHINSNYSLRDSLLDWYSINEPNDFHLYGKNWDRVFLRSNNSLSKLFNYSKFDIIFRRLDKRFKSIYQGTLASKYQILSKYKFQFCLENCIGFEGYMTEKIFDALICRNLPVYHPSTASSLDGILPNDIYINMYDFKSFGDLNQYLNSMSLNEYTDYILRIDHFIDDLPSIFEKNYWAKTVALNIVNDLKSLRIFQY
jgi:hypothetical protein